MALTHNGVKNSLPSAQLPSGYTRPTVTTFSDHEYAFTLNLTVDKATVDNATASTTMAKIIGDASIGLDKQIEDIITNDFDVTNTVTAWSDWTALSNNFTDTTGAGDFLTTATCDYECTVKVYVKVA